MFLGDRVTLYEDGLRAHVSKKEEYYLQENDIGNLVPLCQ